MLVGHDIVAVGIGTLRFKRRGLSWEPASGAIGFVAHQPTSAFYLRTKAFLITLAGPASSFLFWMLLRYADAQPWFVTQASTLMQSWFGIDSASAFLQMAAVSSLIIGSGSLLPVPFHNSDGHKLLEYLSYGSLTNRQLAIAFMHGCSQRGLRPREWDSKLAAMALDGSEAGPNDDSVKLLRYNWCSDTGRVESAQTILEEFLKRPGSEEWKVHWLLEASWNQAIHGNLASAQWWFEKAQATGYVALNWTGSFIDARLACQTWKAHAAIMLLEGRFQDALNAASRALQALRHGPIDDLGLTKGTREDLEILIEQARLRFSSLPASEALVE